MARTTELFSKHPFPNSHNGNSAATQPNSGNNDPQDKVGLEENPYTMEKIGTEVARPVPRKGFRPWDSLHPRPYVLYEDLTIKMGNLVQVILEKGGIGRALVLEIKEATTDTHLYKLMWVYSRDEVRDNKSWPDDSSYMLSTHVEVHKSDVIKDNDPESVGKVCTSHIYSVITGRICKPIGKYIWAMKVINSLSDCED